MAAPKRSSFGTRLLTNFLTYHGIFWNLRPLKSTTSAKFPWQVEVAVDLVQIRKVAVNERCQKFSMQCSRDGENRGKGRMHWNKRIVEQGLNFTVNVDFWFCNEDFCKNPEGKKGH